MCNIVIAIYRGAGEDTAFMWASNARCGSAVNHSGIIASDAGLINGEDLKAGAIAASLH